MVATIFDVAYATLTALIYDFFASGVEAQSSRKSTPFSTSPGVSE